MEEEKATVDRGMVILKSGESNIGIFFYKLHSFQFAYDITMHIGKEAEFVFPCCMFSLLFPYTFKMLLGSW